MKTKNVDAALFLLEDYDFFNNQRVIDNEKVLSPMEYIEQTLEHSNILVSRGTAEVFLKQFHKDDEIKTFLDRFI